MVSFTLSLLLDSAEAHFFLYLSKPVLVGKPEGKRPLGIPRRRWKDRMEMDLREISWWAGWWSGLPWLRIGIAGGLL
jgi:hypothetical protein